MTSLSPNRPAAAPVVIPQDRPVYRINDKFFGPDDTLYISGSYVVWTEEPNTDMEPMNDLAQKNMTVYLKKLDALGREVAAKTGKAWNGLADAHANAYALAQKESKTFESLNGPKQVPLMGAKKNTKSIEQIDVAAAAPLMGTKGKLSLGHKNETVTTD
jgi:hypothetical protein